MTPILLAQPSPSQNDPTREVGCGGETTAFDSNTANGDFFDILLAEELLAVQAPAQQSGMVIQTPVLLSPPSLTGENQSAGDGAPLLDAETTSVPLQPDSFAQEDILPLLNARQNVQNTPPASGATGSSRMRSLEMESSANPILAGAGDPRILGHEESVRLSGIPSNNESSDSKLTIVSPLQQEIGVAREGSARTQSAHRIVQDEKPPLPFLVGRNPQGTEFGQQPGWRLPAALLSQEKNDAQGDHAQIAPQIVRGERQPLYSGMAQAEVERLQDAKVVSFLSPPSAEGRTGIRTLSHPPRVLQGVLSEKSEESSAGKDRVKSVVMVNSQSEGSIRVEARRSNDQHQAAERQHLAAAAEEPRESATEKALDNPQQQQQLTGDEMKSHSGILKTSERTTVASVVSLSRTFHAEPTVLGSSAPVGAHESISISPNNVRALMEQVKLALSLQVREQTTEVRIRLQPESLGTMVVSVQQEEASVAAEIRVEHSSVKAAIDLQLPSLRQALQSQGLDLQRLEVIVADQSMGREFFHQAQTSQKRRARNSNLLATESSETFTPRSLGYNTLELLF